MTVTLLMSQMSDVAQLPLRLVLVAVEAEAVKISRGFHCLVNMTNLKNLTNVLNVTNVTNVANVTVVTQRMLMCM